MKTLENILQKIKQHKIEEVAFQKSINPIAKLKQSKYFDSPTLSLKEYINRPDKSGVIAEFKRKSPSKPNINLYADPEYVTIGYMQSGASALSILTDQHFFGGSNKDLEIARDFNYCPILRKDFTIDQYQIYEAKSIGADAILLIAELLSKDEITAFTSLAQELNLEVLLEIHDEEHLSKINDNLDLIGINNRNLKTFETDFNKSIELINHLPHDITKISESGIQSSDDIQILREKGFNGFLIGELFMREPKPELACRTLINSLNQFQNA
jgi:indole-3-glycerol phosphate synthase